MKTTDLIDQVADKAGIARDAARLAVDVMLTSIVDAAKQGEEVNLPGFGKFKVKQSPARQGRNPATGETIEIAAARKLGVRASETGEGRTRGLNTAKPHARCQPSGAPTMRRHKSAPAPSRAGSRCRGGR